MLMLSCETSAVTCSAALTEDGRVLKERTINEGRTHSETLMPLIDDVMTGHSMKDIDVISISYGPGSFTGVRIGVATVKGLALPFNTPVIGVSALEAAAMNFISYDAVICPAMDARRNQFYTALFWAENGTVSRITDDAALQSDEIEKILLKYDKERIILCADGAKKIKELINIPNTEVPSDDLMYQNAVGVALAAQRKEKCSAASLMPFYLRPSGAERNIKLKKTMERGN